MLRRLRRWFSAFLVRTRNLPAIYRFAVDYVEAADDARRGDDLAAEKRLLSAYGNVAMEQSSAWPAQMLMAFVSLRLGNPAAAAEIVPIAIQRIRPGFFANHAECAYVRYAGKLVYEEATRRIGAPRTLDVGLGYEDFDITKVRAGVRDVYPLITQSSGAPESLH